MAFFFGFHFMRFQFVDDVVPISGPVLCVVWYGSIGNSVGFG